MREALVYYVYAMGAEDGPIKIGVTSNLLSRLATIKTSSPVPVHLIYVHPAIDKSHAFEMEKDIAEGYKEYRRHGEWYNFDACVARDAIFSAFTTDDYFRVRLYHEGNHRGEEAIQ